jgi:hypothetical protein
MKKILIIILLVLPFNLFSQSSTCWPSFRGNSSLTGTTKTELPDNLKLLWSYKTGDAIKSSPIYCNKNIFVGSMDGGIYSISSDGKLNWKYETKSSFEAARFTFIILFTSAHWKGLFMLLMQKPVN